MLPATLDDVENSIEHGTMPLLAHRDHRGDTAEAGGHAIAWAYPAAVVIQAGHDHRPP
jgi:hypothetical protein